MAVAPSKAELTQEIIRCGRDVTYFLNNFGAISHPKKGKIPFKTYQYQDQLLKDFRNHRFNIINKSRQLGATTIVAGFVAHLVLFQKEKNVLIVATKQDVAINALKKVKSILQNLPKWMMIADINVDNRTSIELTNGSKVKAASKSADAGRSEAVSLLVVDEAVHVDEMEELWTALYPSLSTGGDCIVLSTPNGVGNWFHQTAIAAQEGTNDFHYTFLPWTVHPDHDKAWFLKETKNMSQRQIAQELLGDFLASGETVINPDDIERLKKDIIEPKYKAGFDRNFWIWKEYDASHSYLMTVDTARGDGKDYSTFQILDLNTWELAAEYKGKVKPDIFAPFLFDVGKQYGNALIAVEYVGGLGEHVASRLLELQYPNLYWSQESNYEYINQWDAVTEENKNVPGYKVSYSTRPLIVAKMEEFVRQHKIKIYSMRLIEEFKTFVWKDGGKPEAMKGSNDDLIMAFAGACWVSSFVSEQKTIDETYNKAILNNMTRTAKPFTGASTEFYASEKRAASGQMSVADYMKYSWVIKK